MWIRCRRLLSLLLCLNYNDVPWGFCASALNPKGTTIKAPKAAKKALTVNWTKQASKMSVSTITGYQVQLATNKTFTKGKKQVNVKGYKKTSYKATKLKAKPKYFVRVRTYKKVGSTTYYSSWSAIKNIKTK